MLLLPAFPEIPVETVATLPDILPGGQAVGPYSQVTSGKCLRVVPGLARFLASDGRRMQVMIEQGANLAHVGTLLQGPLTAALIYQRGEFPLHGASLSSPDGSRAIALVGNKGAGKSTQAHALVQRGWQLINDDLSRLSCNRQDDGADAITVWPGRGGIRLCDDACRAAGLSPEALTPVGGFVDKFMVEAPLMRQERRLDAIVMLDRGHAAAASALSGMPAMAAIGQNTFRPNYPAALGVAPAQLALVARIAKACSVLRISSLDAPDAYAGQIEQVVLNP